MISFISNKARVQNQENADELQRIETAFLGPSKGLMYGIDCSICWTKYALMDEKFAKLFLQP